VYQLSNIGFDEKKRLFSTPLGQTASRRISGTHERVHGYQSTTLLKWVVGDRVAVKLGDIVHISIVTVGII